MTEQASQSLAFFRQMSDEKLAAEFSRTATITTENIRRLAMIVRVREERGHDLGSLNNGLLRYLRKVADDELEPAIVARCAAKPGLMDKLSRLPKPQQREWLEGKREVAAPTSAGRPAAYIETEIELDQNLGAIVVTGRKVVITCEYLERYLKQLNAGREWMCRGCGELFGATKPVQCAKCGAHSFERTCRKLATT
jgi:rubrerythrin